MVLFPPNDWREGNTSAPLLLTKKILTLHRCQSDCTASHLLTLCASPEGSRAIRPPLAIAQTKGTYSVITVSKVLFSSQCILGTIPVAQINFSSQKLPYIKKRCAWLSAEKLFFFFLSFKGCFTSCVL